jgi:signal peptide peptidase SppA
MTMNEARGLAPFVNSQVWAMLPEALHWIVAVVRGDLAASDTHAAVREPRAQGAVQVIPVTGPITLRGGGLFELLFGGTSVERLRLALRASLNDPNIGAVVLDIDSPGGSVMGIDELSQEIFRSRGTKPVVAVANGMAASAAYWIGSAADEMMVTPTGEVGSIGVWAAHIDFSKALDEMGEKITLISAGKYKVEGNPYEPLGDEARDYMQGRVDEYYQMFVKAVARNRQVSVGVAREDFGQGRMLGADAAKAAGMVDRIGTLDDAISRAASLMRRRPDTTRARAVLAGL